MTAALARAQKIAAKPAESVRLTKMLLREGHRDTVRRVLAREHAKTQSTRDFLTLPGQNVSSERSLPQVGDVRQVGLVAGIELVRHWQTREPFELRERVGIRVCEAMARRGVLTRPIGNVIVLMPPYCTTSLQLRHMVTALFEAVLEICGGG